MRLFSMIRALLLLVFVATGLLSVLGVGSTSTETAVNIATALLTLVIPFVPLAHLPFTGPQMVAASMLLAFVIAIAGSLITGDLKAADLQGGALPLLGKFAIIWAGTQAVFQLFKDRVPALTTAPIAAAPAPKTP